MKRRTLGAVGATESTVRSGALRLALATAFAALLLVACHPLTNPVDPTSSSFTGQEVGRDSDDPGGEPETVLPPVVRWESVAEHNNGQFLALPITADGSFIEPRQPDGPEELYIVVTFEEQFEWHEVEEAVVFIRVSQLIGVTSLVTRLQTDDAAIRRNQAYLRLTPPGPPFFAAAGNDGAGVVMLRIRIVDPGGEPLSDRLFGIMPGDYDGNGTVDGDDLSLPHGVLAYDGFLVDPDDPQSIRADIYADGAIDAALETELITNFPADVRPGNLGETLPDPPPAFE